MAKSTAQPSKPYQDGYEQVLYMLDYNVSVAETVYKTGPNESKHLLKGRMDAMIAARDAVLKIVRRHQEDKSNV